MSLPANAQDALSAALTPEQIRTDHESLSAYGQDWTRFAEPAPAAIAFPRSTEEVATIVKLAREYQLSLVPSGGRTGLSGGAVATNGELVVSLEKLNFVNEINATDRTIHVGAGAITQQIQEVAESSDLLYPVDFASSGSSQIGGNIATNAGGPRCLKYGVTRSYVLGLEVVLPDGKIAQLGGRVHKNKTGFDLVGLFTGSEGMLGIVTVASLRLIPKPPARAMLAAVFPSFPMAAAAVQGILDSGHLPSALEITDGFTLAAARKRLGPERLPDGNAHLIVEVDGRPRAVDYEIDELEALLEKLGATKIDRAEDEASCEAVWQMRREFSYSLRDTGLTKLNEDIVVPRSKLVELVTFARQLQHETGIAVACFGHAGDGNIHTNLMVENYDNPGVRKRADAALDKLFQWVLDHGGAITGEHGVGLAKQPWIKQALGENTFNLHKLIKGALDPEDVLNPGKFLG